MCKQPLRILHQKSPGHKSGEFIGFYKFSRRGNSGGLYSTFSASSF